MSDVKRRFELSIQLSADEMPVMRRRLEEILMLLDGVEGKYSSVGGGYSSGHIVTLDEHPGQTHEKWEADLEAWLATRAAPVNPQEEK